MATVKQIAEHLDVSSATVSRVLNNRPGIGSATRQRVLEAARSMGFERDNGLHESRYIGFVHPLGHFNGDMGGYHSALIGGIGSVMSQHQFDLALIDPYRDKRPAESFGEFFLRKGLRGAIVQVRPENDRVVKAMADERLPIVLVASHLDHPDLSTATVDSAAGYEQAVEHLVHLGHRDLGLVGRTAGDWDHRERVLGFERAIAKHGLAERRDWRWTCDSEFRSGQSIIRRIATLPDRPTALLFTDGKPAIGAVSACKAVGIDVPGELSIVGFDDSVRRFDTSPAITCVCQNALRLGEEAATLLLRKLAGEIDSPQHVQLPATFEVCETTGPATLSEPAGSLVARS
ncbi:MAG: LacI family DNA-binding transcriptional regulator [Planctomycetota bacterium]